MPRNSDGQSDQEVVFPVKGLDVSDPINRQKPLTTIDAENVRAIDPQSDRNRGAQRSGLVKACPDQLAAKSVQEIFQAVASPGQAYGPGGADSFVPISSGTTGFTITNVNGVDQYTKPRSNVPKHATFSPRGDVFVAIPGAGGVPIFGFEPRVGNLPAAQVNNGNWGQNGGGGAGANAIPVLVPLGVVNAQDAQEIRLDNLNVLSTEMLVVAVGIRFTGAPTSLAMTFGGNAMTADTATDLAAAKFTRIYSYKPAADMVADLVGTLDAAPTLAESCMVVSKIKNLTNRVKDDSGEGLATATSVEFNLANVNTVNAMLFGAVITNGPSTDDAGNWVASTTNVRPAMTADQRDGTTTARVGGDMTVSTAYRPIFVTGTQTGKKSGFTSRDLAGLLVSYK